MKQPKKPTLKELKKKPAFFMAGLTVAISYPNGDVSVYILGKIIIANIAFQKNSR